MTPIYIVTTARSGFGHQEIFRALDEAIKFFEAEAAQIGAPVRLTEDYEPSDAEINDPNFALPPLKTLRVKRHD